MGYLASLALLLGLCVLKVQPQTSSCPLGTVRVGTFPRCVRPVPMPLYTSASADQACRRAKQKLLTFDFNDFDNFVKGWSGNIKLKTMGWTKFWIGGFTQSALPDFRKRLDNIAKEPAGMFKSLFEPFLRRIRATDARDACYNILSGHGSNQDRSRCRTLRVICLGFDPFRHKLVFESCSVRRAFICEVEGNTVETVWSDYYNIDTPAGGSEFESLGRHKRAAYAKNGACLCWRPSDVRCRIVGTQTMLTPTNNRGFRFNLSPTGGFVCINAVQNRGVSCPNVEVSYLCEKEEDTCDKPGVRQTCRAMNRECVNRCGAGYYCRRVQQKTNDAKKGQCCLGENQDRCYDTGVCSAVGDPHYYTFDNTRVDFMGPCTYTLVESVDVSQDCPAFMVEAENRGKPRQRPTWLKTIFLKYKGHVVELRQRKVIVVDGSEVNLPYESPDHAFEVRTRGSGRNDFAILRTDFCLVILWDGDRRLRIEAPTSCIRRVRGLCGNWNRDPKDDWTKKNGELVNMRANQKQRSKELGESWEVPNPESTLEQCMSQELSDCTAAQEAKFGAKNSCGLLLDRQGPFRNFLRIPKVFEHMLTLENFCKEDACNSDEPDVCSALQNAEDEMLEAFDVSLVGDWRAVANCPARCGENMEYNPKMTSCQPTCADGGDEDDVGGLDCPDPNTFPGCQCKEGLVLSGTTCVPRSSCGCASPVGYLEPGQDMVDETCKTRYKCTKKGDASVVLETEPYGSCSRNAMCKARKCVCNPGYTGNGKVCEAEMVTCPPGYRRHGTMCYRLNHPRRTWMEAQQLCGCATGGVAQLCAAHTREQASFLTAFLASQRLYSAVWGAGNTMAERRLYDVIMQTTPSQTFSTPRLAGCHVFVKGRGGSISPQVRECDIKLPYCCQIDPRWVLNQTLVWTDFFLPWKTPSGGSAFTTKIAIRRGDVICPGPKELDCKTADGKSWRDTGDRAVCNPSRGFFCLGRKCSEYKVRGLCLPDINECKVLGRNACPGGMECINCLGGYRCQCPGRSRLNTFGKCEHPKCGKCYASGDPHYASVGGRRFDWQGSCKYVLAQTCPFKMSTVPTFPCFKVVGKNKKCGRSSAKVTCTNYVEVHIFHKCSDMALPNSERVMATLHNDGTFAFGGKPNRRDTVDTGALKIMRNPGSKVVELSTPWGLKVMYRGSKVYIDLPDVSAGMLCGLCGDCLTPNVFTLPNGTELTMPAGRRIPGKRIWPVALAYEEPDPSTPGCPVPEEETTEACDDAQRAVVADNKHCGFFKDSRFDGCRGLADEEYEDCLVDLCAFAGTPELQAGTCTTIGQMVERCRAQQGPRAPAIPWRTSDFCPLDCGTNETFSDNALLDEMCGDLGDTDVGGLEPVEGCVCQDGFKRDPVTNECVEEEECGCVVSFQAPKGAGRTETVTFYLSKGDVASEDADCRQVRCQGNNELVPANQQMDPVHGMCDVTKIPPTPKCQHGFLGDGFNCTLDPDACESGWKMVNGKCTTTVSARTWERAAARCAEKDAVLFSCNSEPQCHAALSLMERGLSYWSRGIVRLGKNNVTTPIMEEVGVSMRLPGIHNYLPTDLPADMSVMEVEGAKEGEVLCHALAYLNDAVQPELRPCNSLLNALCVKHGPEEPKVFTEWCNTRDPMNPDQWESTPELNEAGCKICHTPDEVQCRAVNAADRGKPQEDSCGPGGELLYRCAAKQGRSCITKEVRGKCYPGLDECALKLAQCGQGSTCEDLFYGYRCRCPLEAGVQLQGECVPTKTCTLGREATGGLVLNTPNKGSLPAYRTRCRYKMAENCDADPEKPHFRVDVSGVVDPRNPNDYSGIEVIVSVKTESKHAVMKATREAAALGDIWNLPPDGAPVLVPLPLTIRDIGIGIQVAAGDNGRITISHPSRDFLRIELCLHQGCQTLVKLETSDDYYETGCGACLTNPVADLPHTEDFLDVVIADESQITCSRAPEIPTTELPTTEPPTTEPPTTEPPTTKPPTTELPTTEPPTTEPPTTELPTTEPPTTEPPTTEPPTTEPPTSGSPPTETPTETPIPGPPGPEPPIEPCARPYTAAFSCGYLQLPGGPFEDCDPDYQNCLKEGCLRGPKGVCTAIVAAIENCPAMSVEDKKSALVATQCQVTCPENMYFSFNVMGETPTCREQTRESSTDGSPRMQCVCKPNLVLSRGRCVPRAECGCRFADRQVERGAEVMTDDCSKTLLCLGEDEVKEYDTACPANSSCSGNGTCICHEGARGDCCNPVTDKGNMTCYRKCDGSEVCNCKEGYVSQCDTCIDLDECATNEHNCDPFKENCKNTPGSFSCDCASGYKRDAYTGKCTNINECLEAREELGYELCGQNSVCTDRPGHYVCSCCAGYLPSPSGCVPDPEAARPPTARCCRCMGPRCLKTDPLCYREAGGQERDYASYKAMYERRCLDFLPLRGDSYRPGPCSNTTAMPPASACGDSICTPAQKKPAQGGAVCQTNKPREFPTVCDMLMAACLENDHVPLTQPPPHHNGRCVPAGTQFTPWGAWTPCVPVNPIFKCNALGSRMRTRKVKDSTVIPPEDRVRQVELCNLPACEGGTPTPVTTCGDSSYCPNVTNEVCARVGANSRSETYVNPCFVYRAACTTQHDMVVILHEGPCGPDEVHPLATPCGKPLEVVREVMETGEGNLKCEGQSVVVGVCDFGFCPTQDTSMCCQIEQSVFIPQIYTCFNSTDKTVITKQIVSALSCKCAPLGEGKAGTEDGMGGEEGDNWF